MEDKVKNKDNAKKVVQDEPTDFTDVVGGCGRWQWQVFAIYFLTCFPSAWNNLIMTFFAPNIDHWCAQDEGTIAQNISVEIWKQKMIPLVHSTDNKTQYSQCRRYIEQFNFTDLVVSYFDQDIGEGIVDNRSNQSIGCDKWEYDSSSYTSTVLSQWDLVCDREWLVSAAKSVYMAGFLAAVLILGQMADKIGRRPVLIMSNVIFLVSGVAAAFSVSFSMFAVCRFFIALGASGSLNTGFVTLMEVVGAEDRSLFGIGVDLGWSSGYVLLPAVAFFFRDWFHLQLTITIPFLLLLICWWMVPESPRWLLTQGKLSTAEGVMKNIAKTNKKDASNLKDSMDKFFHQLKQVEGENAMSGNALDLFRTPGLRKKTFNLYFIWFVNAFIYYGLSYNTNELGGSTFLNFLISGAVEFPAVVATIFVIKRYGRKIPLTAAMVSGGIACILILPVPTEMSWLRITFAMIGKFFVTASFDIVYVYSAEIYPTVIRNIGIGTSSTCARLGSMLAPFVRELGSATHPSVPFFCFGGLSILSGVLVLLLPETNNCKIPDSIEDAELFGSKNKKEQVIYCDELNSPRS